MCEKKNETISHNVSGCGELTQKGYRMRQGTIARIVHWKLCGK